MSIDTTALTQFPEVRCMEVLNFTLSRSEEITDENMSASRGNNRPICEFEPEDEGATVYYLYVVDDGDRLVDVMSMRNLLNSPEDDLDFDHMETDLMTVYEGADPVIAARQVADFNVLVLPVIDHRGRLLVSSGVKRCSM